MSLRAASLHWKAIKQVKILLDSAKLDIYACSYEKEGEKKKDSLGKGLDKMSEAQEWLLYLIDDIKKD